MNSYSSTSKFICYRRREQEEEEVAGSVGDHEVRELPSQSDRQSCIQGCSSSWGRWGCGESAKERAF